MNICLIQTEPQPGVDNLPFVRRGVETLGADLYILPELFNVGFGNATAEPLKYAERLQGPLVGKLQLALDSRPQSSLVAGLLERDGDHLHNSAAIVQRGFVSSYRQKSPPHRFGRCFTPGDYQTFYLGRREFGFQALFGLMICHDYYMAEDFFAHYKSQRADAIIMIAESAENKWRREFPDLCKQFEMSALVCNAAGISMGGSCAWDSAGTSVPICRSCGSKCNQLSEFPEIGILGLEI